MEDVSRRLSTPVQIRGESLWLMSLADRMAAHHVPGVGVAYFRQGRVRWTRGFGVRDARSMHPVTGSTEFQAASISKPIAATVALTLVRDNRIGLDEDIRGRLGAWSLPFDSAVVPTPITLRQVLSHSAGFPRLSFLGYAAADSFPSLQALLAGEAPARGAGVRVVRKPGSSVEYSGAGFLVLQQLVTTISGISYEKAAHLRVLQPLGMTSTSFDFDETKDRFRGRRAAAHDADGAAFEDGALRYPESAAAGVWTTPEDLARFALHLAGTLHDERGILSRELAVEMFTRQALGWGLGWELRTSGDSVVAALHTGANRGFRALLYLRPLDGEGLVVMTNSENGGNLFAEILAGAAIVRGWTDALPQFRIAVILDSAHIGALAGVYEFSQPVPGSIVVRSAGRRIFIGAPGLAAESEYFAADDSTVFDRSGNQVRFELGPNRAVRRLRAGEVIATRSTPRR